MKQILLTFDIEEFDLPLEFGVKITEEEQFETSRIGTEKILELLDKNNVKATFFISAKFASKYPSLIKKISEKHEIGLHCLEHKDNYQDMEEKEIFERLSKGKEIIEKIINKRLNGFRSPRFQSPNYNILSRIGIIYDSSLHPTYIPGRYNNFFSKRTIFSKNNMKIIPLSVSPILRLPLFWLAFRNFPLFYSKYITNKNKKYVCLIFHPWEFTNINDKNIPWLIRRNTGEKLIKKLQKYIEDYRKYKFNTISSYLLTS